MDQIIQEELKAIMQGKEIQKNYDFAIPDYVLSEWAYAKNHGNFNNVIALIGLAKIHNTISLENANRLKQDIKEYCFEFINNNNTMYTKNIIKPY